MPDSKFSFRPEITINPPAQRSSVFTVHKGCSTDSPTITGYIESIRNGAHVLEVLTTVNENRQPVICNHGGYSSGILLDTLIYRVEQFMVWNKIKPVTYSIQILPSTDTNSAVSVPESAVLVYSMFEEKNLMNRFMIRSSDFMMLQCYHAMNTRIPLVLAISQPVSFTACIAALGFIPAVFSPSRQHVSKKLINEVHEYKARIIPHSVNTPDEILILGNMGVDGVAMA